MTTAVEHHHIQITKYDGKWRWEVRVTALPGAVPRSSGSHRSYTVAATQAKVALLKVTEYVPEMGEYG